jgi:hypothetical protein
MYIDLEMEMYLKRLEDNIRSQSYWVVLPEESKWRNDQLGGAYLIDGISVPLLLKEWRVLENGFVFDDVDWIGGFKRRITVIAIDESKKGFLAKVEKLLTCQSGAEVCEVLLGILAMPVTIMNSAIY